MNTNKFVTIDGKKVLIENEPNVLELARKAKIDIPTFCYHSELSVYGACRLCMVEIEGRGMVASCSTAPADGMVISTNTQQIREYRKINLELLLASHDRECPTCAKSTTCQLQTLAKRMGIDNVRFKSDTKKMPIDDSAPSLIRDPNKCILCGDCVRMCTEVQSVGAIDFAYRGSQASVVPAFNKDLDSVECVHCGQCARVCPTGAITPKPEINKVWDEIAKKDKVVVAQIAPAVRVAIGEMFGFAPGTTLTGQIVAALRAMGFDKVYDTSFTADLTVIEEANEFITRFTKGENMPQFTSCCPAWVKFAEQYYAGFLPNLSSCKSPQQMFGSMAKEVLPAQLGVDKENLVVVSIMPCTAKKFEAKREEFTTEGMPDVDHVLTTQELGRMIEEAGIRFEELEPESLDLPLGFKTGAGVIFANTGGVSEAVLRYATEKLAPETKNAHYEFTSVRGEEGVRETSIDIAGTTIRLAVVHGLANARRVIQDIKRGKVSYDLIEVMACPGGCVGGAGQPVYVDKKTRLDRNKGIYENDRMLQMHKSQDNPYVMELYKNILKEPNSHKAHELLHTHYKSRKRMDADGMTLTNAQAEQTIEVEVCFGTSCFLKGSQQLFKDMVNYIQANGLTDKIELKTSFCFEKCNKGPVVRIDEMVIEKCTFEKAKNVLENTLSIAQGK